MKRNKMLTSLITTVLLLPLLINHAATASGQSHICYYNDMESTVPYSGGSQTSTLSHNGTYSETFSPGNDLHSLDRFNESSLLPTLQSGESFSSFVYNVWVNDNNANQTYKLLVRFAKESWQESDFSATDELNIGNGWHKLSFDITDIVNTRRSEGYTHMSRFGIRGYSSSAYADYYVDDISIEYEISSGDDMVLADNGQAHYHIYHGPEEGVVIQHAAQELASYLQQISGASFTVTTDESSATNLIVVGRNNPLTLAHETEMGFNSMSADSFRILNFHEDIYIAGAIERGTLYGVYHFLDTYFGVRWFSPEFEVVPARSTLSVAPMNDLQIPRFTYREIFNADTDDGNYRQRNRLNGNRFHRIYEDYDDGINTWSKHVPGGPDGGHTFYTALSENCHDGGQILAMDSDCRQEAANTFINAIIENGDDFWYGFFQMDNGWWPDDESRSFADAHGGTLSAPIVDMVTDVANRVRQTHPNAKLGISAYQWSFEPPTGLTVPDYLMIEIAPIHADFGKPYSDLNNSLIDATINGWAQIAGNLNIWDYITNFQNYLQPLPNIFQMSQNIQYLANISNVKGYFGEGSYGTVGAEFAALRAWVAARLLWNPNQDYKSLIDEFIEGYYGPSAPYIKQYVEALHQSLQETGERISVRQRITSKYLSLDFIQQADHLLADADAAASGNYSRHVHEVRLGVDMTIRLREHLYEAEALERGITWTHDPDRRSRFEQYVTEAGIVNYSEDSSIDALYAAMDINRTNPPVPGVADGLSEEDWVDYQDIDLELYDNAEWVEDSKASDNGAVKKSGDNGVWAIQMKLNMLPTEGEWTLYAYVRVEPKSGGNPDNTAFYMGVDPGEHLEIKLSEVQDAEYHVFEFPNDNTQFSYETGRDIWFSAGSEIENFYVDRIVAVRFKNNVIFKNDLIIDFGDTYGLWLKMNNSDWVQLHSLSPKSMVTADIDASGQDDVIIDFGTQYGIWVWMNNNDWVQLHSLSPKSMVTADIDVNGQDDVIIDFGTQYGIWVRMNNSDWVQLHSLSPKSMVTGDIDGSGQDDVIIDFGASYGIWVWMNNSDWVQLHSLSPDSLVVGNVDGSEQDDVIIDFGTQYGIWVWMNNSDWVQLHSLSPKSMVTGDDGNGEDEIIIDFGAAYGIWVWMNNSDWVQLHSLSPESLVTGDIDSSGQDDVIIDFGVSYGIWVWMNNSDWVQLHSLSPDSLVVGNVDGLQESSVSSLGSVPLPNSELIKLPPSVLQEELPLH